MKKVAVLLGMILAVQMVDAQTAYSNDLQMENLILQQWIMPIVRFWLH